MIEKNNWQDNWIPAPDNKDAKGGQGVVRKVICKNNDSLVGSLKSMHADNVKDSERVSRFCREVEALSSLNDPFLPKIYESGEVDGVPYFIEEWIDGQNLYSHVQKNGCCSVSVGLNFIRTLAKTVDSVHSADIVHRDIKPDNIIVDVKGRPHLVDFGICWRKPTADEKDEKLTENGQEIGNRFLRLPEFSAGNKNRHSVVSDITYIVGVLFYITIGRSPRQLVNAVGQMPHESLDEQVTKKLKSDPLWDGLYSLFSVGFKQNINYRFQTCMQLIEKIDSILNPPSLTSDKAFLEEMKTRLYDKFAEDEEVKVLQELRNMWGKINSDFSNYIYNSVKGVPGLYGSTNQETEPNGTTYNHYYSYDTIEGRVFSYHLIFKRDDTECRLNVRFDKVSFQRTDIEYPDVITAPISDMDLLWQRYVAMKDAIAANIIAAITHSIEQSRKEQIEPSF